jgi:hypothetical protein
MARVALILMLEGLLVTAGITARHGCQTALPTDAMPRVLLDRIAAFDRVRPFLLAASMGGAALGGCLLLLAR